MIALGIGIILLVLKYFQLGPVAGWSWFIILAPFALAIFWWEAVVPLLGLDKKGAHEEIDRAKKERQAKAAQNVKLRR